MFFSIHGVGVFVDSRVRDANVLIHDRLLPYRLFSLPRTDLTLTLRPILARASTVSIPKSVKWFRSRPLWGNIEGKKLTLTDGASRIDVDYEAGSADFSIHPDTLSDSHFFARTFFLLPLTELLRSKGFCYLHAALARKEDRTVLLLGEGGAGKSTLCAALMKTGWTILGDDNVLLRLNEQGECEAYPLEQELSVSPEIAAQLQFEQSPSLERGKLRFPLFNRGERSAVIPNEIIFLSPTAESTNPDASEIFQRILNENQMLLAVPHLAARHTKTIETLIEQTRRSTLAIRRIHPLELVELARHFPVFSRA